MSRAITRIANLLQLLTAESGTHSAFAAVRRFSPLSEVLAPGWRQCELMPAFEPFRQAGQSERVASARCHNKRGTANGAV